MQNRDFTRTNNKSMVLEIIRQQEKIFRAELSRLTGLSIPTIMKITDGLIQNGLVSDVGKGVSSGGKPPMMLELNAYSRLFVGLDISGAMIKCIIMNLRGNVVFRRTWDKSGVQKGPDFTPQIISFIETTVEESKIERGKLSGIGIGVPGIVDTSDGRIISSIDCGWKNFDLKTPLEKHFRLPVYIDNSSKVMAIGEQWFGEGTQAENFALVTVGRGIGAAFVINNEIYEGAHSLSGEVGHMVIDPNGPLCKCGKRGCLETFASGKAIQNQARQLLESNIGSNMLDFAGGDINKLDADTVFKAAAAGDMLAQKIADNAIHYLAVGLGNLVALLDCQLIVLTGYVTKDNEYLLTHVRDEINTTRSLYYGDKPVEVKLSNMGEEAAVIGAATIGLRNFIDSDL